MSDAAGSGERKKVEPITVDRVLQTVGGILLTVSLATTAWVVTKISDHDGNLKVDRTDIENLKANVARDIQDLKANAAEQKRDNAENFKEIKRSIEKLTDKISIKGGA